MGFENEDNLLGAKPLANIDDWLTPSSKEIMNRHALAHRLACTSFGDIADIVITLQSRVVQLEASLRKAVEALMTVERCAPGYDWNADPLYLTRIIGEVYQMPEWEKIRDEKS